MLRQPVGGHAVMARQVRRFIAEAERPNLAIHVIPMTVPAHPALFGAFVVLEFAEERPVVFIEGRRSGLFPENSAEIKTHTLAVEMLMNLALDEQESLALLQQIGEVHEKAR